MNKIILSIIFFFITSLCYASGTVHKKFTVLGQQLNQASSPSIYLRDTVDNSSYQIIASASTLTVNRGWMSSADTDDFSSNATVVRFDEQDDMTLQTGIKIAYEANMCKMYLQGALQAQWPIGTYLLLEDGDFILNEDGGKISTE